MDEVVIEVRVVKYHEGGGQVMATVTRGRNFGLILACVNGRNVGIHDVEVARIIGDSVRDYLLSPVP